MLNHVIETDIRFGYKSSVDASPYEHINYVIKQFIRSIAGRKTTALEETVKAMNLSCAAQEYIFKERKTSIYFQLSVYVTNTSLEGLNWDTTEKFKHLDATAKECPCHLRKRY